MQLFYGLILISVLIFLSSKVKIKFIPSFIIAGFGGLLIGEQFLNFVNWQSFKLDIVSEFLITSIFAIVPFQVNKVTKKHFLEVKSYWGYTSILLYLQWLIGICTVIIFFNIPKQFATVLPAGFIGGHSTALALGEYYKLKGWSEGFSLFTSSATIGFIVSIIGGVFLTKSKNVNVENSIKTKLNSSSLTKCFLVLLIVLSFSYALNIPFKSLQIPWFIAAFIVSHIIKFSLKNYPQLLQQLQQSFHIINNFFTRFLITISITILNVSILFKYKAPLLVAYLSSIGASLFAIKWLAPKLLKNNTFEKSLMAWGWTNGVVAVALALNQAYSRDDKKDLILEEFALCYLLISPLELGLLIAIPFSLQSLSVFFIAIILISLIVISFYAFKSKNLQRP
jgi:ESS family glutamate:Na+ symporter